MVTLTRPEGSSAEDFHLSRRGLASVFFAGYAAAAFSAEAEPIHTDEVGLITETVMLPAADRPIPGYLARPAAKGRFPTAAPPRQVMACPSRSGRPSAVYTAASFSARNAPRPTLARPEKMYAAPTHEN